MRFLIIFFSLTSIFFLGLIYYYFYIEKKYFILIIFIIINIFPLFFLIYETLFFKKQKTEKDLLKEVKKISKKNNFKNIEKEKIVPTYFWLEFLGYILGFLLSAFIYNFYK